MDPYTLPRSDEVDRTPATYDTIAPPDTIEMDPYARPRPEGSPRTSAVYDTVVPPDTTYENLS